ncbi:hypothetical protein MUP56_01895, partial [Patescibacteria group bacterium]|nr:hypothetical protein [Patescibacteria group bacterium]
MSDSGSEFPESSVQNPEFNPQDAQGESWSTLELLVAARRIGESLALLRQWDHTGRPDYKVSGNPGKEQEVLEYLSGFLESNRTAFQENQLN